MGIALWLACAVATFVVVRNVKFARPSKWIGELVAAILSALAMGTVATALDFGGWNEPDWRAGMFVVLGSAAVIGVVRLISMSTPTPDDRLPTPGRK